MKIKYFLTSLFQNKFGEAVKYYDEKGWHWMLSYDKPILFDTIEEANESAKTLNGDLMSEITIKEIKVYDNVYELVLEKEESIDFLENTTIEDVVFEREKRTEYILLSLKKLHEKSHLIEGLYLVDRKNDIWIYCLLTSPKTKSENNDIGANPQTLIALAFKKLEEARAVMQILDFNMGEIKKLEGVMMFVQRILKDPSKKELLGDDIFTDDPKVLISEAYDKLEEAKAVMQILKEEQAEISKVEGVMMFVKKILN